MANQIIQQFPSENGVSPEERGTLTRPFVIAEAAATGSTQNPWSRYIPFPKGTELQVEGKIRLLVDIPFEGTGKIEELTDGEFDFSVLIPVDLKDILPSFLAFLAPPKGDVSVSANLTYIEDGSSNKAAFSILGRKQQKAVHIQSKTDERILTPPAGLEISTGLEPPFPTKVDIREVRLVPAKDRLEIKVTMAAPVPDCTISVFRKK